MTRRLTLDDLGRIAVPEQPALHPLGTRVVYVLRTNDLEKDRTARALWTVPATGGHAAQLTCGPDDSDPAWSPDGSQIAFLRAGQVWLLPATGGEPRRLTDLPQGAGAPRWSPDGSRVALTAQVAPIGHDPDAPVVIDRLDYQADGHGLLRGVRSHVYVLDLASGQSTQLTQGDLSAGPPSWSPDGTQLTFVADHGRVCDIEPRPAAYVVPVRGGRPDRIGPDNIYVGTTGWDLTGMSLLLVAAVDSPTAPATLLRAGLDDNRIDDLMKPLDRTVMPGVPGYPGAPPQVTADGAVVFCLRDAGCTHAYVARAGSLEPLVAGEGRVVSGLSVAGQTAAVVVSSATSYGEVAVVDLATGTETVLTAHGLDNVDLYVRERRTFEISDGSKVDAWLLRDPSFDGPRPTLLDIHGGPHNAWNGAADEVHLYHQLLAARGWLVVTPNPRGSDGYGHDFYNAVTAAWGVADAADFLEPLDQLVRDDLADPDRLAVTGYSYGGFATCWLTGHDDRFAAAVAGGVVSDLVSMSGTADDAHLLSMHELGGLPWAAPETYAAMSPLTRVDQVSTPTLLYHGQEDRTCPVGQAQQWFTALRQRGVPTRLVLYPGASHLLVLDGRPSHRRDLQHRVIDWVEQYAGAHRPLDSAHWQARLHELAAQHQVPGAQLAILRVGAGGAETDESIVAVHGLLSTATGVEVTPEAQFQIGSITKLWTATLIMRLVDEGLLELDTPVTKVLPDFALADPDATAKVTLRHLLTHTSGIDGDIFTDTGRGDDCLEKYVTLLHQAAQNHPLGATWSYCNSGFSVIGRMVEILTGKTWDAALKEKVIDPLELDATTLPEEALLHRVAVGHVRHTQDQPFAPTPVWLLPRAVGPAGLINASARDIARFARMHLAGGVAEDGTRVLTHDTVAAMSDRHAELPDPYLLGDSWGLGWIRFNWDDHRLIGHDGSTLGQAAFLRILPDQGLVVALTTNGGNAHDLYEDLYREIFAEVAGVAMPRPLSPPAEPPTISPAAYVGTFERASVRIDVLEGDYGLVLRTTVTGPLAELIPEPVEEHPMRPVDTDLFAVRPKDTDTWIPVTFYALPTGERYLHFGARATPQVDR